jgi:energy-coupling factor transport system permease protein
VRRSTRLTSVGLLLVGLVGICVGVYALLDASTPGALGLPLLVLGVAAAVLGMLLAGRRSIRTRYRPDPWALPEWLVSLSGLVPATVLVAVSVLDPVVLVGQVAPPAWPTLPLVPAAAIALAALAGVVSPRPPGLLPVREDRPTARDRELEEVAA